jgi:hypothetical protein
MVIITQISILLETNRFINKNLKDLKCKLDIYLMAFNKIIFFSFIALVFFYGSGIFLDITIPKLLIHFFGSILLMLTTVNSFRELGLLRKLPKNVRGMAGYTTIMIGKKAFYFCLGCATGSGSILYGSEMAWKSVHGAPSVSPWRFHFLEYYHAGAVPKNELGLSMFGQLDSSEVNRLSITERESLVDCINKKTTPTIEGLLGSEYNKDYFDSINKSIKDE